MRKVKRLICKWCAGAMSEGRVGKEFCSPACCCASWRHRNGVTKAPRTYGKPWGLRRPVHDRTGERHEAGDE